jgi:hypothetical protein
MSGALNVLILYVNDNKFVRLTPIEFTNKGALFDW